MASYYPNEYLFSEIYPEEIARIHEQFVRQVVLALGFKIQTASESVKLLFLAQKIQIQYATLGNISNI